LLFEVHEDPSPRRVAILSRVDGLITISDSLRNRLHEIGLKGKPIKVEHDGVDLAAIDANRLTISGARKLLGLNVDSKLAVYAGALHPNEMGLLLAAARQLDLDGIRLLIVGGTEAQVDEYKRKAFGLPIDFAGFVPHSQVAIFLQAADVLVMPYTASLRWSKHFSPLKLFEYMAAGRPIVATDIQVLREVIQDGRNAVIAGGDPVSLAGAIAQCAYDPALAKLIAQQALSDVQHHSWDARASRIVEFIDQLPIRSAGVSHN
jgi:glycosyltransferase involved in cell wall biosynthesis